MVKRKSASSSINSDVGPKQHRPSSNKNIFETLPEHDLSSDMDEDVNSSHSSSSSSNSTIRSTDKSPPSNVKSLKKPPPIFVKTNLSRAAFIELIHKHVPQAMFRASGSKFQVFLNTPQEHVLVLNILSTNHIEYYTFTPSDCKPSIFVIRGIDHTVGCEDIFKDVSTRVEVIRVLPMTRRTPEGRKPFNGFQVHFPHGTKLSDVKSKINSVCYYRVSWELPRKVRDALQCHRCQRFGHGASNCNMIYRCVKCVSDHLPTECKKAPEEKPLCVNCGKDHTANYGGCSEKANYIKNIKNSKFRNAPAVQPRAFCSTPINSQNTFAEITAPKISLAQPSQIQIQAKSQTVNAAVASSSSSLPASRMPISQTASPPTSVFSNFLVILLLKYLMGSHLLN